MFNRRRLLQSFFGALFMAAGIGPQILAMLAAKQQGGAGGAATGAGASDEQVGNASSQLQGADPSYALKEINQAKQLISNYISTLSMRIPSASRALASTLKGFDAAIKELQTAQATAQAVGGPVNLSAIPRPQPPGGTGAPSLAPATGMGV
jgi:hypothetical protein